MIFDILFFVSVLVFMLSVTILVSEKEEKNEAAPENRRIETWVCVPNERPKRDVWGLE
jgi:hypothetical protein